MKPTQERWLPVVGWADYYQVSDMGRVRSLDRVAQRGSGNYSRPGRIMRLGKHKFGYKLVVLSGGGRRTTRVVHRVVLEAFIGRRPKGLVACHNNGNPADNRLENLRYDTQSSNLLDAVRQGTHPLASATHCKRGHEFTPENTIHKNKRWRGCRECKREADRKRYKPSARGHGRTRTHCPQGHEYTPENTFLHSTNGGRSCRTCRYEKQVARRNRLRASGLPVT